MDSTAVVGSEVSRPGAGAGAARDFFEQKFNANVPSRPGDGRNIPRFPTPLQVSTTSASMTTNGVDSSPKTPTSSKSPRSPPPIMRSISYNSESPRSPRTNPLISPEQPKSPRERLEEYLASEEVKSHEKMMATDESPSPKKIMESPTKLQSYTQLRNASSPLPDVRNLGNSSPPSPRSTTSPPLIASSLRQAMRPNPRTSSIDSAISNISINPSHNLQSSQDSVGPNILDISNLISAAGSPEAAIQHLLKEKQSAAARSDQLWKLVEKQRSLVFGLNKDLERALEDKERYRKKLKETLEKRAPNASAQPQPAAAAVLARTSSQSPAPSDISADLPIQRQSLESIVPEAQVQPLTLRGQRVPVQAPGIQESIIEAVVPGTARSQEKNRTTSGHAHKQTSSSDVNVFTSPTPDDQDEEVRTSPMTRPTMSPGSSFTAKRSQNQTTKGFGGPDLILAESSSPIMDVEMMTPPRKAPPAPLDLGSAKTESLKMAHFGPEDHSESEYEDNSNLKISPVERGRKKTREDDDRDREAAILRDQASRSQSNKDAESKSRSGSKKKHDKSSQPQALPMPPAIRALAPEPTPLGSPSFMAPPMSLAGALSPNDALKGSEITTRTLHAMPLSPGLPISPRPADRPQNPPTPRLPRDGPGPPIASPPLSPKSGFVGLPLSPRAPRQPIPFPPNTPMSMAPISPAPIVNDARQDSSSSGQASTISGRKDSLVDEQTDTQSLHQKDSVPSPAKGVFTGFVSESYPGLLIPPNALPSIKIKVVSSRLKPSRHSLVLKGVDDEPVFTLGVSARYDRQDLWQVEKPILSLQQLDQQLRQSHGFNVKVPDRSLFSGHAPSKVDARRTALENYFEAVLDTQMNERAAIALCKYLSTQVSEPASRQMNGAAVKPETTVSPMTASGGKLRKEGYLTKRGKNFGGWKARFFVLDRPVLEYYESPGGRSGPLGQIKLQNAQIGKQSPRASVSPSRNDEGEGQYRHAFLIREPKRKDATTFVDHVLCAESDAERDAWVAALLCYVEGTIAETEGKSRPSLVSNSPTSSKMGPPSTKNSIKSDATLVATPDVDEFDSLQAVPYEETKQAQAPHMKVIPDQRSSEMPSPSMLGVQPPTRTPSNNQSRTISGPQNGVKISDVGAWGNKPMATPLNTNPREPKKRGLFGFRDNKSEGSHLPNGSNLSLTQQQQEYQEHATNVKAVFGASLIDAVEYCAPRGVDVCLPAVVYRCLQYLVAKNAANEEGIFRMSGSNNLIKHLRHKFNTEGDFDFLGEGEAYFDVHAIASLLKLYLRELPSMILTKDMHIQFLAVLDLKDDAKKVTAYNVLVHKLPTPNFNLIKALSGYLIDVVNNSEINKMGIRNVCIVFSPTLNIPSPVLAMFLSSFEDIFEKTPDPESARNIPALEITSASPEGLSPDDIRSPRKQMFSPELQTPSFNQPTFNISQSNSPALRPAQVGNDTGFAPLQASYDGPISVPYGQTQAPGSVTIPGPEYVGTRSRDLGPGGEAKARRRESSMLM